MIHYLYIKTHNVTGLKYLGQTISKDPHKYTGSGVYWKRHLKAHGSNFTTTILLATESKDDLIDTGIFFSRLFGVVQSSDWANLIEESGTGGNTFSLDTYEKIKKTKLEKYGNQYFNNRAKVNADRGITNISQLESVRSKISAALTGKPKSETHKANMRKPRSTIGKENIASARRKSYLYDSEIIYNAKEYCIINGLSYQMFLRHAKLGTQYKNKSIGIINAG